MKKFAFLVALVMVLALGLTACTGNEAPSASQPTANSGEGGNSETPVGGTGDISVQIGPNPETMDPALNSTSDASSMILHTFECLLTRDATEELQPGQAVALPEVSEDGLVYTFTLRDGLVWSDGTPLTAADFEWSWKRAVAAETAAPYADMFNVIAGFEEANAGDGSALQVVAVDDTTLQVTLSAPCPYFMDLAAFPAYSPVQRATVEANGEAWATQPETYIGNGAFQVTEWVPREYILFTKNPNYWDAANIQLNSIRFLLMEDENAVLTAYQNGGVMLAKNLPANEVPTLRDNPEFRLDPLQGTYYLSLNLDDAAFQDPNVRRALNIAIDRDYIANTVMQGTYAPASSYVGPGVRDVEVTTQFIDVGVEKNGGPLVEMTANVEEAKRLMEEAGYSESNPLRIAYTTNDSAYHVPVAEAMQQMYREIYVEMEIDIMEWASFTPARREGDYQMARNGWVNDYNDPSTLLDLFYSTNGNNDGNYSNPAYDALIETARGTGDQQVRMDALHEAEQMLFDEAAMISVAYYADFYLINPSLEGFYHSSLGYFYFMHASVAA